MEKGFADELFIPGIVVDQRDGPLFAGEFVVMQLIVFGIEQMNPGIDGMELADLFLQGDEGISFLGITGDGDAGDGKFDSQLRFDGCGDDGVVTEDLLGLIGIGGHAADADAGVAVVREFGAAKTDRIRCFTKEGGKQDFMNVGLSKSENQTEFGEGFLDVEELEVIAVDSGEFIGSVFKGEGKDCEFGAFDVLGEVGIGAFDTDAAFFAEDNLSGILDSVEHPVMDFLNDIVNGDRGAGVVKLTAASITSGGRKQGSISGLDVVVEEAEFLDQRNEGMESLLITVDSDSAAEVGEGGAAGNAIIGDSSKAPIRTAQFGIAQDGAEVFDVGDLVEIAGQVENEQRDGVVARGSEDGIGIGGNGSNEREIDEGCDKLRESAADGAVVVDVDKLGMELITGEPSGFFLGKRFGVGPVDSGIDFLELGAYSVNREPGEIDHLGSSRVSGEGLRPSKTLSRTPFLFSGQLHKQTHTHSLTFHRIASSSWCSMKAGDTAVRSCSRA